MIATDVVRTIANAPPRPPVEDRVLIDESELQRRLDDAYEDGHADGYNTGYDAGFSDALVDFENNNYPVGA